LLIILVDPPFPPLATDNTVIGVLAELVWITKFSFDKVSKDPVKSFFQLADMFGDK
jgi:hypothetical protein